MRFEVTQRIGRGVAQVTHFEPFLVLEDSLQD